MGTEEVILRVRKWLWVVVGIAGLFPSGLAIWMAFEGRVVRVSIIPTPLLLAVWIPLGLSVLPLAWRFLSADSALRLSNEGVAGWTQPPGFKSVLPEQFEFAWSEVRSIDEVSRWTTQQVRITTEAGAAVFVNPIHISGFAASDAGVIVALVKKGAG